MSEREWVVCGANREREVLGDFPLPSRPDKSGVATLSRKGRGLKKSC
jgi:hypothetical protein